MVTGTSSDSDGKIERKRRRKEDESRRKDRKRRTKSDSEDDDSSDHERRKRRKSKSRHKKHRRRSYSSDSESESDSRSKEVKARSKAKTASDDNKLLEKLAAKGETLEEREERRAKRRAAKISAKFGYTADENPFNDPNLHVAFAWKKKKEKEVVKADDSNAPHAKKQDEIFEEIEKVRKRRLEREQQFEEMERIRREESRMKELENYDEWARKEEEFHLLQQRQRSAIRLVEGREKPVDVLAKNLLMFGLTEDDQVTASTVKYQERYNAMNELESLEAELEEPHNFLKLLKLHELEEVLVDIDAFRNLEREASALADRNDETPVLKYWDALYLVAEDEVKFLKSGGAGGSHAQLVEDIRKLFEGQSVSALIKMREEIDNKLRQSGTVFGSDGGVVDKNYWRTVREQLDVHLAKMELSETHSKMLVRQLERLEEKKEELKKKRAEQLESAESQTTEANTDEQVTVPQDVAPDFGNLEEELGLTNEIDLVPGNFSWQDKFRPRKPRYFNRVKTGYDWNKYNQTHFDHDNPPPKIVQGYKFNIFYPDLVDPTKTPQYRLEPADTGEFCIIRFHAGPPYEDVAFKIVNREWNKSRKHGFRSTFERGVLSLYFNFTTHWYRR